MSAPRWEEYARLVLTKLDEHGKKLDALQGSDRVSIRKATLWGAVSGMVAALVVVAAPQKAVILQMLMRVLAS